jgi:hypothetical protein
MNKRQLLEVMVNGQVADLASALRRPVRVTV